jgi:hypothetical protein
MQAFVEKLARRKADDSAGQSLNGLSPDLRGQAYAVGVIVLGRHAPPDWRDGAIALLFGSERPYFHPSQQAL